MELLKLIYQNLKFII